VCAPGNDNIPQDSTVFSLDSQHVCQSTENKKINQTTGMVDIESSVTKETDVHEEESLLKDSKRSHISPVKCSGELKNDGTKQPEL